jgi:hypothetical protein
MILPKYDDCGNIITDERYKEIFKLKEKLESACIPFELDKNFDGWRICYPAKYPNCVADAIECFGSYGAELDMLEIMGLLTDEEREDDSVKGYMTADDVYERMLKDWQERSSKLTGDAE